jgi:hypothetical protein
MYLLSEVNKTSGLKLISSFVFITTLLTTDFLRMRIDNVSYNKIMKKSLMILLLFFYSCSSNNNTTNSSINSTSSIRQENIASSYFLPDEIVQELNLNLKRCQELDNTVKEIVDEFDLIFNDNFKIYSEWEDESSKQSPDHQNISDLRDMYIDNSFELRTLTSVIDITLDLEPKCFDETLIKDFSEASITRTIQGSKRRWGNQISFLIEKIDIMNKNTKFPGKYGSGEFPSLDN